jgi:1-acyl-sn-glycerol-3-phosphate acyltransferase
MESHHQTASKIAGDVDRFFRDVFSSIVIEGPHLDAAEVQKHPHMLVSTHRSHIDYFLAGCVLFFRGFKHMRFAAGSNLTRLPYIGPRFRALGAFTVEREVSFERNYVKNLCNRVIAMMENREAVILFPEGGRSYSGSVLEIKSGILGAAVLLQARRPEEDVSLIPMAISYECPPDVPWFGLLLRGKRLRKRTNPLVKRLLGSAFYFGADILAFAPFVTARRTGRQYGAVYVDYAAPVAVRSIVDIAALRAPDVKDEFFSHRAAMQRLGAHMRGRFLELYRLLPMHLVAYLIREQGPATQHQAAERAGAVLDRLAAGGRNLKSLDRGRAADAVAEGTRQLQRLGAVSLKGGIAFCRNRLILDYCAAPLYDTKGPPAKP